MRCSISGEDCLFELGEVTDEALTGEIGRSLRMGADGDGGVRSEEEPLVRMISKKSQSTYETLGTPVDLVLQYDKQYPFAPVEYLARHELEIEMALVPKGPFSRIWIYDGWNKTILWKRC
jgi:hypothetical protein